MYEAFGPKGMDEDKEAKRQAATKMAKQAKAKKFKMAGQVVGGIIGGYVGGPSGAMKGASLGGTAGSVLGGEGSMEDVTKLGTAAAGAMGGGDVDITTMSAEDIGKMSEADFMSAIKGKDLSKLTPEVRAAIMAYMAKGK